MLERNQISSVAGFHDIGLSPEAKDSVHKWLEVLVAYVLQDSLAAAEHIKKNKAATKNLRIPESCFMLAASRHLNPASPLRRLLDILEEHLKAFPSKYEGTSPEELQNYGLSRIPDKVWRQFYELQPGLNQKARISAAVWDRVRMFCVTWLRGVFDRSLKEIADRTPLQGMLLPTDLHIEDLTGPLGAQTRPELCNDGSDSGEDVNWGGP